MSETITVWWLSNEAASTAHLPSAAPKYLRDLLQDRKGRNGRGRLWIPPGFKNYVVTRLDNGRVGGDYPGGIVIFPHDKKYCTFAGRVAEEVAEIADEAPTIKEDGK
jgi:hypothetical protein